MNSTQSRLQQLVQLFVQFTVWAWLKQNIHIKVTPTKSTYLRANMIVLSSSIITVLFAFIGKSLEVSFLTGVYGVLLLAILGGFQYLFAMQLGLITQVTKAPNIPVELNTHQLVMRILFAITVVFTFLIWVSSSLLLLMWGASWLSIPPLLAPSCLSLYMAYMLFVRTQYQEK